MSLLSLKNNKFLRKAESILSEDRLHVLRENANELERRVINEILLQYLVDYGVITENDKERIMVRNFIIIVFIVAVYQPQEYSPLGVCVCVLTR